MDVCVCMSAGGLNTPTPNAPPWLHQWANHLDKFFLGLLQLSKSLCDHSFIEMTNGAETTCRKKASTPSKKALATTPVLTCYNPHCVCRCIIIWYWGSPPSRDSKSEASAVTYAQRSLSDTQTQYVQIRKEALAFTSMGPRALPLLASQVAIVLLL